MVVRPCESPFVPFRARESHSSGARAPMWKRPPSACFPRLARGLVTAPCGWSRDYAWSSEMRRHNLPANRARQIDDPAMTKLELATENGRHLVKAGPGRVTKAPKAEVHPDMSVAEGFTAIVLSCLEHFRSNESAFVDERDPEALHQLRVATRRLRTALDLFRPVLR